MTLFSGQYVNRIRSGTRPVRGDDEPSVPVEVLEAIDNLAEGNTAAKDEIEAVLKF